MRLVLNLSAFLIALSIAAEGYGQEKPKGVEVDALPAGCLLRIGSARWSHDGKVDCLVYSPDGKYMAGSGEGKTISVWDADTGKLLNTLQGHTNSVKSVAFVPPEKGKPCTLLVSGSVDQSIRVWDLLKGKEISTINAPASISAIAISPDGKQIASGAWYRDGVIYTWDRETGKLLQAWRAHIRCVFSLAYSPDGAKLLSGGLADSQDPKEKNDDYALAVWDPAKGEPIHKFEQHARLDRSVAYSSDGKTIASTGIDAKGGSSLRVFDKEDFKDSRIFKRDGGAVDSQAVAISPDGKSIAAAHYGVFIWNQRGVVTHHIPGHRSVAAIAFSPDGKRLAFASETGSVQIWDVEKRKAIHPTAEDHSKPINGVAVSRDGKHVATACQDGIARLWELSSGKFVRELRLEWGAPYLWDVAFSPDGKTLAVAHQREGISLWDYTDGKLIRQLAVDKDGRADEGHFSIAFSPDGKTLAANSVDGGARLFDAKTGDKLKELGGGRGTSVAYSSGDGALLAAASDNQVTIWHADTGKVHLQLNNHASSVAVSKDGRFIAGASNWDLRIWDAKGKEIGHIKERRYGIHSYFRVLEFSPNGKYLAVADSDKVMIWDTGARKQVHSFAGHRGIVTTLSFTPDGSRLISGGEDCTLLVWDFAKFAEKK